MTTRPKRVIIPLAPPEHPWEQQDRESNKAHRAFRTYLEQPPAKRSLAQLSRDFGTSAQNLGQMSQRYDWQNRARAYDRHNDRIRESEVEDEIRKLARTNVKLAMGMQAVLGRKLKTMVDKDGHLELSTRDVPGFLRALAQVETAARGHRVEHSGPGGGPIETRDVDARARLARILGAAGDAGPDVQQGKGEDVDDAG